MPASHSTLTAVPPHAPMPMTSTGSVLVLICLAPIGNSHAMVGGAVWPTGFGPRPATRPGWGSADCCRHSRRCSWCAALGALEVFHDGRHERRQIDRGARGDDVAVLDDGLIKPCSPGIDDVILDRRVPGCLLALQRAGRHQHPAAVADAR